MFRERLQRERLQDRDPAHHPRTGKPLACLLTKAPDAGYFHFPAPISGSLLLARGSGTVDAKVPHTCVRRKPFTCQESIRVEFNLGIVGFSTDSALAGN